MTQPAASLEIATPEAVALDIDVAGLGHRALAWLIDASIIATTWFTVGFTITYFRTFDFTQFGGLSATVQVLLVVGFFFTNWGYALAFETAWRGQTPGKRLLSFAWCAATARRPRSWTWRCETSAAASTSCRSST